MGIGQVFDGTVGISDRPDLSHCLDHNTSFYVFTDAHMICLFQVRAHHASGPAVWDGFIVIMLNCLQWSFIDFFCTAQLVSAR